MSSTDAGDEDDAPADPSAMSGSLPDAALVAYDQNRDQLWRTATMVLKPYGLQANADDVMQEAVISLMKAPPENVKSWKALLIQTVKRRAVDFTRGKAAKHERVADPAADGPGEARSGSVTVQSLEDAVVEADERERRVRLVRGAVAELPVDERHVIESVFFREEKQVDVAKAMGVTAGRLSQLKSTALKRLAIMMEEKGVTM